MPENYSGVEKRRIPRTKQSELGYSKYRGTTYPRQTTKTAASNVNEVIEANPSRVAIMIVNSSSSIVYLGFNPDTGAGNGVPLSPNGGILSLNINDDGEMVSASIYGLGASGGQTLTVIETILGSQ